VRSGEIFAKIERANGTLMLRLAVPEDLCSSPELSFDLILLRTGQSGHFGDVPFGRNAVSKHSLAQLRPAF